MPIDTDILSFGEYNNNCNDENTKIGQLVPLVMNAALSASDTNKIPVRRSGVWSIEGEQAYNGIYQDFGNINGEVVLTIDGTSARTAMVATVTGNTFVTGFGANFLSGVLYVLFIKQDATGGYSVRWPYGASVLKQVGTLPDQFTEVYILKLPNGKIFIKCEAFQNTTDLGSVIKEFEFPIITFPDSSQAPMSFTWSKAAAVGYGGAVTGLYSDWEIADDVLYTNLLFSSYNNTIDLYSIQVVLTQAGQVYMRTRYGGNIGGDAVVSPWDEVACELSGIDGDRYWDQTVLCINANKYGWEGSKKIVDEKSISSQISVYSSACISNDNSLYAIRFGGGVETPVNAATNLGKTMDLTASGAVDFTIEAYVYYVSGSSGVIYYLGAPGSGTGSTASWRGGLGISIGTSGNLYITAGNLSVHGSSGYMGARTNDTISTGIHHIAVLCNNSTPLIFVDGVLKTFTYIEPAYQSLTFAGKQLYSPRNINIGSALGYGGTTDTTISSSYSVSPSNFYIYSLRVTKNICRYTSDFQVDLTNPYFKTVNLWWTPEPKEISTDNFVDSSNWDKVECLINGHGVANATTFTEESGKPLTVGGNTKIDVTSNLSSIIFDGNADYLQAGNIGDYNFLHNGLHNWTAEFWFKPDIVVNDGIFDTTNGGTQYNGVCVYFHASSGKLVLMLSNSSGSTATSYLYGEFNYVFVAGTMYHVAITLDWSLSTDNAKMFVNGVQQATLTKNGYAPALGNSVNPLMIGGFGVGYPTYMFQGRIYSFRISRFLRYTGTFTVDATRPYFITKPKVENWAETSLLINALDLPVGSTDIRDFKGNRISLYGDAKIAKDSNGLEHINFTNTTLDCLQISSSSVVLGNSDFTIQMFLYKTSNNANVSRLYGVDDSTHHDVSFGIDASGNVYVHMSSTGSSWNLVSLTSGVTIANGSLCHLALVRSGGNLDIYLNGIKYSVSTGLGTASLSGNGAVRNIGGQPSGVNRSLVGRIYSYAITKKALYTSNFAVDLTNPYFPAYENALADLWIDGNDYSKMELATGVSKIVDKSGNMREAVQSATASQPALVQNVQNGLMALDFDGVDDYLSLGTALAKHSEWFVFSVVNITDAESANTRNICGSIDSGGSSNTCWGRLSSYISDMWYTISTGSANSSGYTQGAIVLNNVWNLLASSYKTGMDYCRQFLNDQEQSVTKSTVAALSNSGTAYSYSIGRLGDFNGAYFYGKFSELLLCKFDISDHYKNKISGYAVHKWALTDRLPISHPYKTGFPVEDSRTDDYWYATVLCINGTDIIRPTEIVDSSRNNKITVYGDTKALIDANNKPYINFDGSGDYLSIRDREEFYFTGKTTVETFVSLNASKTSHVILSKRPTVASAYYFSIASGSFVFFGWNASTMVISLTTTTVLSLNTVYHLAAVVDGLNVKLFVNGILEAQGTCSSVMTTSTQALWVGNNPDGNTDSGVSRSLNGKIYGMRVTDGILRYPENFQVDLNNPYFPKKQNDNMWIIDPHLDNVILSVTAKNSVLEELAGKTITNYGSTISTSLGHPTIYFDGNDYFTIPSSGFEFLILKNRTYTFEFFSVPTSTTNYRGLFQYGSNNNSTDRNLTVVYNTGTMNSYSSVGGSSGISVIYSSSTPGNLDVAGKVNHHAFCFNKDTRMADYYINGTFLSSLNVGAVNSSARTEPMYFGRYTANVFPFVGHLSAFRITTDVIRYTEDFEIPEGTYYFPSI